MTHAALSPLIGPEFDEFLCAPIGEDRNGTMLSVLSALARLDVDPWQEATSLARMPREAAAVRLSALIEALRSSRRAPFRQERAPAISLRCCRWARLPMSVRRIAFLLQPGLGRRSSWRL